MARSRGGTTFCVASLCEASAAAGVGQSLISMRAPGGEVEHLPNQELVESLQVGGVYFPALRLFWSPSFRSVVRNYCRNNRVQIIHSHGIWTQPKLSLPLSPGNLVSHLSFQRTECSESWALRHHSWKKRPVWWLWERRNLRSAALLHTTAQKEVDALRAIKLCNPAAIIPIGVDVPPARQRSEVGGQRAGVRTALFFSRIHPKKGLLELGEGVGLRCVPRVGGWWSVDPMSAAIPMRLNER